jgi:hypothetical protein
MAIMVMADMVTDMAMGMAVIMKKKSHLTIFSKE